MSGQHLKEPKVHFCSYHADISCAQSQSLSKCSKKGCGSNRMENQFGVVEIQKVFLDPLCCSCTWALMLNYSVWNKSDAVFITSSIQRTFHPAVLWGLGVFNKHVNYHSSLARMQHLVLSYWRTLQFEVYRAIKDPHGAPDIVSICRLVIVKFLPKAEELLVKFQRSSNIQISLGFVSYTT